MGAKEQVIQFGKNYQMLLQIFNAIAEAAKNDSSVPDDTFEIVTVSESEFHCKFAGNVLVFSARAATLGTGRFGGFISVNRSESEEDSRILSGFWHPGETCISLDVKGKAVSEGKPTVPIDKLEEFLYCALLASTVSHH